MLSMKSYQVLYSLARVVLFACTANSVALWAASVLTVVEVLLGVAKQVSSTVTKVNDKTMLCVQVSLRLAAAAAAIVFAGQWHLALYSLIPLALLYCAVRSK